jgi:8-oxo-dGTP diphosphatase
MEKINSSIEQIFAVVAIIRKGDRFLATSRKGKPNELGLPGGKLEEGEDPYDALVREVREETGVQVLSGDVVFSRRDEGRPVLCYMVHDYINEPSHQEKGIAVKWAFPEELTSGPFGVWNKKLFKKLELDFTEKHHTYCVFWSIEHNDFMGQCNQYPGLMSLGETPDSAWEGIRKIVNELGDLDG